MLQIMHEYVLIVKKDTKHSFQCRMINEIVPKK